MEDIKVAVCDDSALMRNLIGRIIDETEGLSVLFKAQNGQDLLDKLENQSPDIILLDIEMPVMTGVEFLKERKQKGIKVPVLILSSIAKEGAAVTMECLSLGACDFITKPGGSITLKIGEVSQEIIEYVSSYGGDYAMKKGKEVYPPDFFDKQIKLKAAEKFVEQKQAEKEKPSSTLFAGQPQLEFPEQTKEEKAKLASFASSWQPAKQKEKKEIVPVRDGGRIDVICLGISTGGPNALRVVFPKLDPKLKQPILVVQHMPAGFTKEFAASLDALCPMKVTEARDGEPILDGHVYIAQGNKHMYIEQKSIGNVIRLSDAEQRNGHRPSVDVLFESAAKVYQNHALGVIMTGMGGDGAKELANMRKEGAWTLGQDEGSSIVYGMPRVAWELGGVQKQVSLEGMAAAINELANAHVR